MHLHCELHVIALITDVEGGTLRYSLECLMSAIVLIDNPLALNGLPRKACIRRLGCCGLSLETEQCRNFAGIGETKHDFH